MSRAVSSRDDILSRVRRHANADVAPPDAFTEGIVFADPVAQFSQVLAAVGGRCELAGSAEEAGEVLSRLASEIGARKVCSLVDGMGVTNFDIGGVSDPHDLEDVDLAVMPGELAVAENAAVWVTATSPLDRTLFFLTQHLALILPRPEVVSNLHQAYERIDVAATAFGTWISGPSKTADIEQSLVLGAHGPRSLTVVLVDEGGAGD